MRHTSHIMRHTSHICIWTVFFFIVQHILALIVGHHQVLLKYEKKEHKLLLHQLRSQPSSVYKCCY